MSLGTLELRPPAPPEDLRGLWWGQWGRGFPADAYADAVRATAALPFARSRLRVAVLRRRGALLCGARVFRLAVRLGSGHEEALGIGSVITPRALRGRGHASRLLRAVHAHGRREGAAVALLHSDISPAFYERLGYRALPSPSHAAPAASFPRPFRTGLSRDPDAAAALRAWRRSARRRSLSVEPSAGLLAYKTTWVDAFHRTGAGTRGHPWWLARGGAFLLSRRIGCDLELMLWGGPIDDVTRLVATAIRVAPDPQGVRVRWEGPEAAVMAQAVGVTRRRVDRSFMVRPLRAGLELPPRGWDPWPIERF